MYKIYTKDSCSYCTAAKDLLRNKKQPFVEFTIGRDVTKEMLLEIVPHARSVPQIFYNDEYIGGYDNLLERMKNDDPTRVLLG